MNGIRLQSETTDDSGQEDVVREEEKKEEEAGEEEEEEVCWNFPPTLDDFNLMECDEDPSRLEEMFVDKR